MKERLDAWLQRAWYGYSPGRFLLLPLTFVYAGAVLLRKILYRLGVFRRVRLPVPVIVVGNIVAGGAGKTPVSLYLAQSLASGGMRPGIVSRGYGRDDDSRLRVVAADSDAREVGDEPLLLARRSGCPVVVGRDRVAAAGLAIDAGANVIIADDGLQHYRLQRDFEICVIDAARGLGNGWQLPAGPLREPATRLAAVDAVLVNATAGDKIPDSRNLASQVLPFRLRATEAVRLDGSLRRPLCAFAGEPVHAVAGIGNPERFFMLLEQHGLTISRHPLPDHAGFDPSAPDFEDGRAVVMTEKDAVKLGRREAASLWYVPVDLCMDEKSGRELLDAIEARCRQRQDSAS